MTEYVRKAVPVEKQWQQLAEEAAELAQAALKVCRTLDDTNPTPVSFDEAIEKVHEEIADVRLALEVLDMGAKYRSKHSIIMVRKLNRWIERLLKRVEDTDNGEA